MFNKDGASATVCGGPESLGKVENLLGQGIESMNDNDTEPCIYTDARADDSSTNKPLPKGVSTRRGERDDLFSGAGWHYE